MDIVNASAPFEDNLTCLGLWACSEKQCKLIQYFAMHDVTAATMEPDGAGKPAAGIHHVVSGAKGLDERVGGGMRAVAAAERARLPPQVHPHRTTAILAEPKWSRQELHHEQQQHLHSIGGCT